MQQPYICVQLVCLYHTIYIYIEIKCFSIQKRQVVSTEKVLQTPLGAFDVEACFKDMLASHDMFL